MQAARARRPTHVSLSHAERRVPISCSRAPCPARARGPAPETCLRTLREAPRPETGTAAQGRINYLNTVSLSGRAMAHVSGVTATRPNTHVDGTRSPPPIPRASPTSHITRNPHAHVLRTPASGCSRPELHVPRSRRHCARSHLASGDTASRLAARVTRRLAALDGSVGSSR